MEAIRISCAGYPTRKTFDEFISRFKILESDVSSGSWDEVTACSRILENAGIKGWQIGKTKVFLRAGQMAELDSCRGQVLGKSASVIQRKFRSYSAQKNFLSLRFAAVQIQALCRGHVARCVYKQRRRTAAASIIQKNGRMFLSRKEYLLLRYSAVLIQAGIRGMAARNELLFRKQNKAAIAIQSHCRGFLSFRWYSNLKKAAITIQCACRVGMARGELQQIKMAAKETGALQEAKSKLEKQVVELTSELQLEKSLRVQETAKLQSALDEMQVQLEQARDLLMKERGGAKNVVEQVPLAGFSPIINHEGPVLDHELVNKLTAENEKLKLLVSSLEKKIDETESKFEEMNKLSEDRLKQALEAESKIIQLKTEMQRLEEKLADMETTDQILRHQALLNAPSGKSSGHLVQSPQAVENDPNEPQSGTPTKSFGTEADSALRKSNIERQRENIDTLIRCITKDLGFSEGKPVAAFTIYKCLIHWKSFEAERTNVFDRLIQIIGSAIEDEANNDRMNYWLSNTSTLLFLLQRTLKVTVSSQPAQPTSFFGRMTQGFRSFPSSADLDIGGLHGLQQVEAKYPALLFKEQLTAYVEKIYGIIRDNSKKELTPLLSKCIKAPRTSPGGSPKSPDGSADGDTPTSHWKNIVDSLNGFLSTMKDNFVPAVLVQKIFTQIFSYINVQLFNSLLLRKECCTFNNGEHIKAGLAELEIWCESAQEYASSSWDELKYVRQAVGLLVIQQKSEITYDNLTTELCPILSSQQLYRICTLYSDDNSSTENVSPDVISRIKILTAEDSDDADSSSFLLDDNSSIPFSVDEISSSLQDLDFTGVKPAPELVENPAFEFLQVLG